MILRYFRGKKTTCLAMRPSAKHNVAHVSEYIMWSTGIVENLRALEGGCCHSIYGGQFRFRREPPIEWVDLSLSSGPPHQPVRPPGHISSILGDGKLGRAVVGKWTIPSLLERRLALHLLLRQGIIRDCLDKRRVRRQAASPGLRPPRGGGRKGESTEHQTERNKEGSYRPSQNLDVSLDPDHEGLQAKQLAKGWSVKGTLCCARAPGWVHLSSGTRVCPARCPARRRSDSRWVGRYPSPHRAAWDWEAQTWSVSGGHAPRTWAPSPGSP